MTTAAPPGEAAAPQRFLLRPAGLLTQLCSASCLLLGTIAFVLVQQNKSGGTALVIAWVLGAMAGLVIGGLMARGGLIPMLCGAALTAGFGIVLIVIEYDSLRSILRLLPESDVAMIADILIGAAIMMVSTAALCLASIPQALRYGRALREAEAEQAASSASLAMAMPLATRTLPPGAPPPGASTAELVERYSIPSLRPAAGGSFRQAGGSQPSARPGPPAVRAAHDSAAQTTPSTPAVPAGYGAQPQGLGPQAPTAFGAQLPPAHGPQGPTAFGAQPPEPYGQPAPGFGHAASGFGPSAPGHGSPVPSERHAAGGDDAYRPPAAHGGPPGPGEYADPLRPHIPPAASTARGWTPSPVRHTMALQLRPKAEETRSRRRVYFILGGLAVGLGAGVGVMVSSMASKAAVAEESGAVTAGAAAGSATTTNRVTATGQGSGAATGQGSGAATGAGSGSASAAGSGSSAGPGSDVSTPEIAAPNVPIRSFLAAQREAIGKADAHGLAEHVAPTAFAFGINAEDVAEGRVAIEAMLAKSLGDAPPDGFTVTSKYLAIGEERNHAWVAEELELSDGSSSRRIALTQLAAFLDGKWTTVALHWAEPVPDALAERRTILGTMPKAGAVPNKADGGGDLDKAVRAAFASRLAFVDARSDREDAFNFGSGPNERTTGRAIKRLFARLRSELAMVGGARVVAGSTWDPAQEAGAWIGFAAFNADYTYKSRAATDLTQTFRVLAVLVREGETWTIVQTQFSNGGPIR